jgi:hypothetical protein
MSSRTLFAVATIALASASGCSSLGTGDGERVGSTSEAVITPVTINYQAQGSFYGRSETVAAYVNGTYNKVQGRWIVGWNTCSPSTCSTKTEAGWAFSSGPTATSWTTYEMTSGTQFGNPGLSPCAPLSGTFSGWRGDPWIVPVTDPTQNKSSQRSLYSNIANTNVGAYSDIVVAYSDDANSGWTGASYVTDGTSCDSTGAGDDMPMMASNPISPYDTYIVWDRVTDSTAWMRKVLFDTTNSNTFTPGPTIKLPWTGYRHRLSFITTPSCAGGTEGIIVTWTDTPFPPTNPICSPPGAQQVAKINWYAALYVPSLLGGTWFPSTSGSPWLVDTETNWQRCVGSTFNIFNSQDPGIATNPNTTDTWIVTTHPTVNGNRVLRNSFSLVCSGPTLGTPTITHTTSPEPCNGMCGTQCCGGTGPDGGPIVQDEWEPTISFVIKGGTTTRVAESYYGTDEDSTGNQLIGVYMIYSEAGGAWSTVPKPIEYRDIGFTETIPWTALSGFADQMWDYNAMGAAWANGTFLVSWGGDNRKNNDGGLIETDLLQ